MSSAYLVVLDAVGTLIHPVQPVAETYHTFGLKFGAKVDRTKITARFRHSRQRSFETRQLPPTACCPSSETIERELWREIVADVFREVERTDELFQQLWNYYATPSSWSTYADVFATIEQLNSFGCRLVIGSNFDDRLNAICQDSDALRELPRYISSSVGYRKPDMRFYAAIQADQQIDAKRVIMIGDDLTNDVAAPIQAGWNAILLDRSAASETPDVVRTLTSLSRIVQGAFSIG